VRTEKLTTAYRIALAALTPTVRWWGRLEVIGLETLPLEGPLLLAGNHDSYWDPIAIGISGLPRRQIRALAKKELWKFPGLSPVLNGMGQIPIDRGAGDTHAMDRALEELRRGACIGIFLEGTRSLGRDLRARSGFGRLSAAVPEAEVVCVRVTVTYLIPQFPKRPKIQVRFFRPAEGGLQENETFTEFGTRLLIEIRAEAPRVIAGRKRRRAGVPTPA
jgi:1-acyl-sn-glycerol-3-phosphate acyltransferase